MTVLVLGSSGQLATHLRKLLPHAKFCGRDMLDLAQPQRVAAAVKAMKPSQIVNAAAYTGVDKAESEPDLAWRINAESVAAIATAATALDVPLVHVSTDYVFDGRKSGEYVEDDPTNPLNVYGATKLAGELATRVLCKKSWILRTSWVFSEHGANFIKTILRLAATRDELRVVADQRGRPTYAGDLATVIAELLRAPERLPFGTYHTVGGPVVSWHGFAESIVDNAFERRIIPKRVPVQAITTAEFPTPAQRPPNSALKPSSEVKSVLGIDLEWREGLRKALAAFPVQ